MNLLHFRRVNYPLCLQHSLAWNPLHAYKPNFNIDDLSDDETAVNFDLIIIDYLNLIGYANGKSLDYIVKQLKNISNHNNINIIATTQLSKSNDESRIPTESDFMISEDVFSKYVDNSILLYEK